MKICIVSFYFPPEKGAAANRIWGMAKSLQSQGNEVTVLCPHPNYPTGKIFGGYGLKLIENRTLEGVHVRRHWLYASNSKSGGLRLFSMLSFSIMLFLSIPSLVKKKPTVFIVNSPPLFTGATGVMLSKILRAKCVLNISDLWPRSALELGAIKEGKVYGLLIKLEHWMYQKAHLIMTQSEESKSYIQNEVPNKRILVYRNLPAFINQVNFKKERVPLKIVYAGLLGVAQGVFNLIKNVDFKSLNAELHIYGDGNEKQDILKYISHSKDCNIFYHGFIPASELVEVLPNFNASLIPLISSIYGAFPSKIYSSMNFGLPILFSGSGEGKNFVETHKIGLTNDPQDYETLSNNIITLKNMDEENYLSIKKRERYLMKTKFTPEEQITHLIKHLNNLVRY